MPVSVASSRVICDTLTACGISRISELPDAWLIRLIRMADGDPAMILVRLAKEEEGVDIAAMAAGAGIPRVATVRSEDDLVQAFDAAREAADLTTLVAKVEAVGPSGYVTHLALFENRFQFARHFSPPT